MAALVLTTATVFINAVDVTDHVRQVTIEATVDTPESTAMGATYRARLAGGIKDASWTIELNQDYAASNLDELQFALFGVATALRARPTSAAISTSNPEYQMTGILNAYPPISGSVGDRANVALHFVISSGALVRDVTP